MHKSHWCDQIFLLQASHQMKVSLNIIKLVSFTLLAKTWKLIFVKNGFFSLKSQFLSISGWKLPKSCEWLWFQMCWNSFPEQNWMRHSKKLDFVFFLFKIVIYKFQSPRYDFLTPLSLNFEEHERRAAFMAYSITKIS